MSMFPKIYKLDRKDVHDVTKIRSNMTIDPYLVLGSKGMFLRKTFVFISMNNSDASR